MILGECDGILEVVFPRKSFNLIFNTNNSDNSYGISKWSHHYICQSITQDNSGCK